MALLHVNFFYNVLGFSVAMEVMLSQPASGMKRREEQLPVLWLLQRALAWLPLPERSQP